MVCLVKATTRIIKAGFDGCGLKKGLATPQSLHYLSRPSGQADNQNGLLS